MNDAKDSSQADHSAKSDSINTRQPATPHRELLPLPGLTAIALYLVVLAGVIIVGVLGRHYPPVFLILSASFLAAGAGLMLLLRWAWALALAAALLLACYNLWIFTSLQTAPPLVQGLLNFVFFLYLIRTEVRSKLR